jgi:lysophospholipase L1-like esterase
VGSFNWTFEYCPNLKTAISREELGAGVQAPPSLVWVLLGGNDLSGGAAVEEVARDYELVISRLHQRFPGALFLCTQIERRYPRLSGAWTYLSQEPVVSAELLEFQTRSATFSDLLRRRRYRWDCRVFHIRGHQALHDRELYCPDGVHLNARGTQRLWQLMADLLAKSSPCDAALRAPETLMLYCVNPGACETCKK